MYIHTLGNNNKAIGPYTKLSTITPKDNWF